MIEKSEIKIIFAPSYDFVFFGSFFPFFQEKDSLKIENPFVFALCSFKNSNYILSCCVFKSHGPTKIEIVRHGIYENSPINFYSKLV